MKKFLVFLSAIALCASLIIAPFACSKQQKKPATDETVLVKPEDKIIVEKILADASTWYKAEVLNDAEAKRRKPYLTLRDTIQGTDTLLSQELSGSRVSGTDTFRLNINWRINPLQIPQTKFTYVAVVMHFLPNGDARLTQIDYQRYDPCSAFQPLLSTYTGFMPVSGGTKEYLAAVYAKYTDPAGNPCTDLPVFSRLTTQ